MSRIKISLPSTFRFSTSIPIRITDLNYGGHVGNDTILTLAQEARMQFLHQYGYTEMELGGASMIMSDAAIEFKSELFYGQSVTIEVAVDDLSRVGFSLYYRMTGEDGSIVALVKTGMVCYSYAHKKVVSLPDEVRRKFTGNL